MTTPAIDARAFVDDERYAAYKASLEERLAKLESQLHAKQNALLRGHPVEQAVMCRIAGEIAGIEHALGLPNVLLASDPTSEQPDLVTP